jgi:hypothetical protein
MNDQARFSVMFFPKEFTIHDHLLRTHVLGPDGEKWIFTTKETAEIYCAILNAATRSSRLSEQLMKTPRFTVRYRTFGDDVWNIRDSLTSTCVPDSEGKSKEFISEAWAQLFCDVMNAVDYRGETASLSFRFEVINSGRFKPYRIKDSLRNDYFREFNGEIKYFWFWSNAKKFANLLNEAQV